VDDEGIDVAEILRRDRGARAVYVTPSHQYPLGTTMSAARRMLLLNWAVRFGAWIIEDDYDSEYRYAGRPIPALQGLDRPDRVIYLGTFSKVLFPSIRLAYLIVPSDLVDRFVAAKAITDRQAPIPDQAILADFMSEGHFGRHIRRMRTLYLERAEALVRSAEEHLGDVIKIDRPEAGMHTIGWLPAGTSDREVSHRAADAGIFAWALSSCYWQSGVAERPGLVLGFAAYRAEAIVEGVRTLARVLKSR
jgi:GntR family transcriptional regulator/MocR family aminotransferase